ncbi:paf1 rna polymerase ii complex component leo1 [Cystoisospora suis]|uniref:Paf1 rna polymerase ii complex component leo1 n=1 Tax=Cystoisospora suis TaxID=483139 RepID=A0A2C6KI09_9APIC|nr:paf1 rna polymerase ii complex component leo1 [Cystoisospora suis]
MIRSNPGEGEEKMESLGESREEGGEEGRGSVASAGFSGERGLHEAEMRRSGREEEEEVQETGEEMKEEEERENFDDLFGEGEEEEEEERGEKKTKIEARNEGHNLREEEDLFGEDEDDEGTGTRENDRAGRESSRREGEEGKNFEGRDGDFSRAETSSRDIFSGDHEDDEDEEKDRHERDRRRDDDGYGEDTDEDRRLSSSSLSKKGRKRKRERGDGDHDGEDSSDEEGEGDGSEEPQEVFELPFQNLPSYHQHARIVTLRLPPTVSVKVNGEDLHKGPPGTRRDNPLGGPAPTASAVDTNNFCIQIETSSEKTEKKDKKVKGEKNDTKKKENVKEEDQQGAGEKEKEEKKRGEGEEEEETNKKKKIKKKSFSSNCRLVEWDDGSFSFFVGHQMFDVQVKEDPTFLFEDSSSENVKALHCRAESRFQVRIGELLTFRKFFTQRKCMHQKKKTTLTTHEQIERAEQATRRAVERRNEFARMRRRQMESLRGTERGLTRNFLEADSEEEEEIRGGEEKKKDTGGDDEDDEDDGLSLAKIKERFKRQKRYK